MWQPAADSSFRKYGTKYEDAVARYKVNKQTLPDANWALLNADADGANAEMVQLVGLVLITQSLGSMERLSTHNNIFRY